MSQRACCAIGRQSSRYCLQSNIRQYTEADLKIIRNIHNLVKVRGFKIAAARKIIAKNPAKVDKSSVIINTLIEVRDELKDIRKQLDKL